jgi:hypothetical protein
VEYLKYSNLSFSEKHEDPYHRSRWRIPIDDSAVIITGTPTKELA